MPFKPRSRAPRLCRRNADPSAGEVCVRAACAMRAAIGAAALLSILPLPAVAQQADLVLAEVRVVDPAARTVTAGHVAIRAGRIQAISTGAVPTAGVVLDLGGRWVIPGLIDAHTHSGANVAPGPDGAPIVDYFGTEEGARRMLHAGVVAFLDLFGLEASILPLRDAWRRGEHAGAELFAAGPCLTAPEGHCTEYGIPTRTLASPEQARQQVAELAASSPDVIKLVYDQSGFMPTLDRATFEAAVAAARDVGIPTVVHVASLLDVEHAVAAGASALTHLPRDSAISAALAGEIARGGIFYIPTIVTPLDAVALARRPELRDDPLLRAVAGDAIIAAYADPSRFPEYLTRWMRTGDDTFAIYSESIRNLSAAGVRILAGSDAGNFGSVLGWSVHREMERLVQAGLDPWEALAAATVAPGDLLGRDWGVGTGDEGSLVVLDASPLEQIANTRRIHMVIHRGEVVER